MRTSHLAAAAFSIAALAGTASAQRYPQQQQQQQLPGGTYQQTCANSEIRNDLLTSECKDTRGQWRSSSIAFRQCRGDIGNNNGLLNCNGAVATGGGLVQQNNRPGNGNGGYGNNGNGGYGNNGNGYGNNGNQGGLYRPGYAYPAYGQRGYGDPRVDPRFAQGGYGYGRPANQWIPISQRATWLNQRIAWARQDGVLSRRDEQNVRNDLANLIALEARYRNRRLDIRTMADLDHRFDLIAARVQVRYDPRRR